MSRTTTPERHDVPSDALADLERRLARVESVVGVRHRPRTSPRGTGPDAPPTGSTSASVPGSPVVHRDVPSPAARTGEAPARRTGDAAVPSRREGAAPGRRGDVAGRPVAGRPTADGPGHPGPARAGGPPLRDRVDEALVGGRVLAWSGGAALLVALGTLFWLGVRDGVITEALRCVIGAAASVLLIAAGLHNARRGRAREASWAMAGAGLGGLYATVAVASATYDLLPEVPGLVLLAALGVATTVLALRWDAQPLAGVGLLGALAAPVIAPVAGLVLPVVITATAATGLLLRLRPWTWLGVAASVLALPQIAWHVVALQDDLDGAAAAFGGRVADPGPWAVAAPGLATVAALAAGLLVVAGWEIRARDDRERWSMPLLLLVHVGVAAGLGGAYALVDRPVAAVVTLAACAALLVGAAWHVRRRDGRTGPVGIVLLSAAVLVLDLGFAIGASGVLQLVGWAIAVLGFAVLARHATAQRLPVLVGGLGLHAGLALVEAVGASGGTDGGFLVACAVLAAVCGASARVVAPRSREARVLLDLTALGTLLWWTAATLPADRLALVLAAEAVALLLLDRRHRDEVARTAGLAFVAVAAGVALLHGDGAALRATWGAVGPDAAWSLVLPLLAVAAAAGVGAAALRGAPLSAPWLEGLGVEADELAVGEGVRGALTGLCGVTALLGASVLAGHVVQLLGGGADAVAVVRDGLWASAGLALLAAGLRLREAPVRLAGLALLAGVGGKIALLDLADVGTVGRVVAWAVLGVLLLAGAALYGRLRPTDDGADAEG